MRGWFAWGGGPTDAGRSPALTRILLATFVLLLLSGRAGLPGGAQLSDLVFPLLAWSVLRGGLHLRGSDRWLGLFLLGSAVAALAHPSRLSAVEFAKLAYGPTLFLIVREACDRGYRRLVIRGLVAAALIVATCTVVNAALAYLGVTTSYPLLFRHPTRFGPILWRARGLFEVPEMLGELLTVAIPLALAWRSEVTRVAGAWLSIGLGILLLAAALTFSHSLAGLFLALLIFWWPGLSGWARRFGALSWGAVFLTIVALSSALPRPANVTSLSPFREHVSLTTPVLVGQQAWVIEWFHYGMLKGIALETFLDSPLTGVGPGGFNQRAVAAHRGGGLTATHSGADPHCELTGRLAETGLVGTLPMLLLWTFWIREGRLARDPAARAAGAAVLGIIINGVHVDFMNFRFFWLALAILESAPTSLWQPATEPAPGTNRHASDAPSDGEAVESQ